MNTVPGWAIAIITIAAVISAPFLFAIMLKLSLWIAPWAKRVLRGPVMRYMEILVRMLEWAASAGEREREK